MFTLNENFTYYLYPRYINMGKGIDSLYELLRLEPTCNPLNGDVFLFLGKKRDFIKILHWDTDGFILYQKRLQAGTYELPRFQPRKGMQKLSWATFFYDNPGDPFAACTL